MTRLRKTLADERRRCAQRLHALLVQEGWACARGRLLTGQGRRWVAGLGLHPGARAYADVALAVIAAAEAQLEPLESDLRRFARSDRRCRTLMQIYGVGELIACHLLAEIGENARFRRPRQPVRAAGLDPVVDESAERRRRGRLAKQGSPRPALDVMGGASGRDRFAASSTRIDEGGPSKMVYAAIDIHKRIFQAAVLDAESGELVQERLPAMREALNDWATRWEGKLEAVALEATTGWRWVWRELSSHGFEVRLCDPGQARALRGSKRRPKTDRLDAAWLARLLAKEMLPTSWLPPEDIQYLRDRTRLRRALAQDRMRFAQRLHALLTHEGWPCSRGGLLSISGQRWARSLALPPAARANVEAMFVLIAVLDEQLAVIDAELRQRARSDPRLKALCTIFGVGPVLAAHLLAEIGQANRFRRARQVVRAAGLDPVVSESAETRRRGKLSKQGSPELRWALVEAAHHACQRRSPDHSLYLAGKERSGSKRAALTVARKIARRAHHVLAELEQAA